MVDVKLYMPIGNNYSPTTSIPDETIGGHIKMSPITWRRELDFLGPEIITDVFLLNKDFMKRSFNIKSSIGLLLEPLEYLKISHKKFCKYTANLSKIFTFEDSLLENKNGKFLPYYVGGSMLNLNEKLVFDERKNKFSFVLSSKRITKGHKFRHKIASRICEKFKISQYGSGINDFNERHIPYSTYQYSIVVENGLNSHLFTEKLIDCLLHKTIPIYWGGSKVLEVFDPRGILRFNDLSELNEILTNINEGKIVPNIEAIDTNQRVALQFISKELNIYRSLTNFGFLPPLNFQIGDFLSDVNGFLSGNYSLNQVLK
jgi:hypothetical protein